MEAVAPSQLPRPHHRHWLESVRVLVWLDDILSPLMTERGFSPGMPWAMAMPAIIHRSLPENKWRFVMDTSESKEERCGSVCAVVVISTWPGYRVV